MHLELDTHVHIGKKCQKHCQDGTFQSYNEIHKDPSDYYVF